MTPPKKGFRSPSDFVNAANDQPALMHVDPVAGVTLAKPSDVAAPAPTAPAPEAAPAPAPVTEPGAAPAPAAGEGDQTAPAAAQPTNEGTAEPAPAKTATKPPRAPKASGEAAPHTHKRATDTPPEPPPAPWANESTTTKSGGFNLRPSMQLHAKIKWVSENVPKHRSLHEVAIKAAEAYVDALIAQHYKPEQE